MVEVPCSVSPAARTNQKRLGCVALVGALFLSVLCRRRARREPRAEASAADHSQRL